MTVKHARQKSRFHQNQSWNKNINVGGNIIFFERLENNGKTIVKLAKRTQSESQRKDWFQTPIAMSFVFLLIGKNVLLY